MFQLGNQSGGLRCSAFSLCNDSWACPKGSMAMSAYMLRCMQLRFHLIDLQTLTTDRFDHDHLDFAPLRIWVLFNTDLHSNRIKDTDFNIFPSSSGNGNRVILRVERMCIFLEGNQSFQTKTTLSADIIVGGSRVGLRRDENSKSISECPDDECFFY